MKQQMTRHARVRWLSREFEGNRALNSHEKRKARKRDRMNHKHRRAN